MKKILFLFCLSLVILSFAQAQDTKKADDNAKIQEVESSSAEAAEDVKNGPVMEFETLTVDYGTMEQHGEPLRIVKFTNTGNEPLIIKNARGSCGCTVPEWPKEPIMPGEESKIEIRYATNRLGKINKTIKITTNEGKEPHVLKVVGKILKPEDESVPAGGNSLIKGN